VGGNEVTTIAAEGTLATNLPVGRVVTGEYAVVLRNRWFRHDGTVLGFIYFAGYAAGAWSTIGCGFGYELARRGYPVICGDVSDTPSGYGKTDGPGAWGADIAKTRADAYVTYLQGAVGAKAGKVGVLYGSHGAATAYAWAYANQSKVACIAGGIGTVDVENIRANNLGGGGGFQASIEAKYVNNAGWQAARPTHNPVEVVASLTAIPQLDYYSPTDAICLNSTHAAMLAAGGPLYTQRSLGNIGHSFGNLGNRSTQEAHDFADWVEAAVA
jgi:hypothetical protein